MPIRWATDEDYRLLNAPLISSPVMPGSPVTATSAAPNLSAGSKDSETQYDLLDQVRRNHPNLSDERLEEILKYLG